MKLHNYMQTPWWEKVSYITSEHTFFIPPQTKIESSQSIGRSVGLAVGRLVCLSVLPILLCNFLLHFTTDWDGILHMHFYLGVDVLDIIFIRVIRSYCPLFDSKNLVTQLLHFFPNWYETFAYAFAMRCRWVWHNFHMRHYYELLPLIWL